MNILVIHQHYLAQGQPGGSRFNEFAKLWCETGHKVTVICGNLNYSTGQVLEKYKGQWISQEKDGEVNVLRCYVPTTYSSSYLGRFWAFFGFTISASHAALKVSDFDIVIATSPPLVVAIPGWIAARLRFKSKPFIFEVRDLWPESAVTTKVLGEKSIITKILYKMESWAYQQATKINVLTPAFREDILKRKLAENDKIVFVPNGADVDLFKPSTQNNSVRQEYSWENKFVAMYSGAHSRANALHQLIEAAEELKNNPNILIVCVGDGTERQNLLKEVEKRGLKNIIFCGAQPKERMPDFINACDLGLAVLQNNPTFRTVYPNKVFDYMACEKPTLLAIDGIARKMVCEEAKAGIFAEPENPVAIANVIKELSQNPTLCAQLGNQGRKWVLANATRNSLAESYLKIMLSLKK
jgi:glycosyltransferase involved in cell wall biosynthesis